MICEPIQEKPTKWENNCSLMAAFAEHKKHKKCCKSFKKGDRCKKCPGRKD